MSVVGHRFFCVPTVKLLKTQCSFKRAFYQASLPTLCALVMERQKKLNVIGQRVQDARKALGWSQDLLAAKCQRRGLDITRGTLAKIESGVRGVADFEAHVLAIALKEPMESLFPASPEILIRKARNPQGTRSRGNRRR